VRLAGRDQAEEGETEGLEMHWWQEEGARFCVVYNSRPQSRLVLRMETHDVVLIYQWRAQWNRPSLR
jgi:hypothetical protein